MLSFVLNKNIPCEIICSKVSRLIESYRQENPNCEDLMLKINVSPIAHTTDIHIPKIENKENTLTS